MNVFSKLRNYQQFTEIEKQVASYIITHSEEVLGMSIRELGQKTYVSPSTIYKMCRKIGYSGYKEFLIQLSSGVASSTDRINGIDVNFPFTKDDSDIMISQKIASLSYEVIQETQQLFIEDHLNKATELISDAMSIFAVGVSLSYNRIMEFHTKMLRINKFVKIIPLQSDQFHLAQTSSHQDVAIVVSYSGETAEVVMDVQVFKQKKCKIIAITANIQSTIAKNADIILRLPETEDGEYNISPYTSQIATEYVLNVLYSCVYKRNYLDNLKKKHIAPTSKLYAKK